DACHLELAAAACAARQATGLTSRGLSWPRPGYVCDNVRLYGECPRGPVDLRRARRVSCSLPTDGRAADARDPERDRSSCPGAPRSDGPIFAGPRRTFGGQCSDAV